MSVQPPSPIFIHSLFRAGSTYMFKAFRRTDNFTCFQEALHELTYKYKDTPDSLLDVQWSLDMQKMLRHPEMDKPYFFELHARNEFWKNHISMPAIFEAAFPESDQSSTIDFFNSLIRSSANGLAVFQECRTPFRIGALQRALGGMHIFLSRNPIEQWWSQKTTTYFEVANKLFIDTPNIPKSVELMKRRIGFQSTSEVEFLAKYQFHRSHQLSYEHQFELFLLLWSLAEIQAHKHADLIINMDEISQNSEARSELVRQFEDVGIRDIDLSDCQIPNGPRLSDEIHMLTEKAAVILDLLETSGVSTSDLTIVDKAMKRAVETSKSDDVTDSAAYVDKLKRINKSQHENALELLTQSRHALHAAEGAVKAKDAEVESLQAKLNESDTHASSLQSKLQLNEVHIASLGEKLHSSDTQLADLNSKLKDGHDSIERLQSQISLTIEKLNTAQSAARHKDEEIETLSSEVINLSESNEKLQTALLRYKADIAKQKRISKNLREDFMSSEKKNANLIAQFEQLNEAHQGFMSASGAAQQRLVQSNSRLSEDIAFKDTSLNEALGTVEEQKTKVRTLEEMIAHQRAAISNRDDQIDDIKGSTSWKITTPLRFICRALSPNQSAISREGLKSNGLVVMRKTPLLKSLVLLLLVPFPKMKARLSLYAKENEALGITSNESERRRDYTVEEDWNVIPTLSSSQKWRAHLDGFQ